MAHARGPCVVRDASTKNETSHSPRRRMAEPMQRAPEWRTMHQIRMTQATAQEGVRPCLYKAARVGHEPSHPPRGRVTSPIQLFLNVYEAGIRGRQASACDSGNATHPYASLNSAQEYNANKQAKNCVQKRCMTSLCGTVRRSPEW